jgi:hypothetical protein
VIAAAETLQREGRERRAADVARRFAGWAVWVTAQGSPVATRSGGQRPPEPDDGTWTQTVIADDWDELETELAVQARHDQARAASQATGGLQ